MVVGKELEIRRSRLNRMQGRRVLVVGDLGLDVYAMGSVTRISPEAPVPVVNVETENSTLGLSGNVAQNVVSLGGVARLISTVGADEAGTVLGQRLRSCEIDTSGLITDPSRPTTRKLRVIGNGQQIVRVDYEKKKFLTPQIEKQLFEKFTEALGDSDVVVLQDYGKGVVSEGLAQRLIGATKNANKEILVDPSRFTPVRYYRGATLLKPNREESIMLSGIVVDELVFELRDQSNILTQVGQTLLKVSAVSNVIISDGPRGLLLFDSSGVQQISTQPKTVYDVTGAGDTVIATLALARAAKLTWAEGCELANLAAGVVVGKLGCVPCTRPELEGAMGIT